MSLTPAILEDQVCGDDWIFIFDIVGDVSLWTTTLLQVTLRESFSRTSQIQLVTPTQIVTTGSVPLDVPATNFSSGVFSILIPKANTAFDTSWNVGERSVTWYLSARTTIDGRLQTFIPPSPLTIYSSINT